MRRLEPGDRDISASRHSAVHEGIGQLGLEEKNQPGTIDLTILEQAGPGQRLASGAGRQGRGIPAFVVRSRAGFTQIRGAREVAPASLAR